MKQILNIYIIFVFVSNGSVLCFPNGLIDFIETALKGKSVPALQNIEKKLTTDKLTVIGRSNFTQIARMCGHKCEEHEVTTEDGYILRLYHIPGNKAKPVLLIHGHFGDAYSFIERGKISMSITLADRGWDVWVLSLRGTTESKRHICLDPVKDHLKFFNFTFYDWGMYDLPATIDYILEKNSQTQLTIITYSQGSTVTYVLGTERAEYNDKVKLNVNTAPVSTFIGLRGSLVIAYDIYGLLTNNTYSVAETGPEIMSHQVVAPYMQAFCLNPGAEDKCIDLMSEMYGRDIQGFGPDFLYTYLGHSPAGSSLKCLNHVIQIRIRGKFSKYDYGKKRNLEVYHSEVPPDFDFSKMTMKTAMFISKNDYVSTELDSGLVRDALPNVVHYQIMPYDLFSHVDFVQGRYMPDNFYPYLFDVLDKYC